MGVAIVFLDVLEILIYFLQSNFCSGIRSGDKHGLPNSFSVLSESFDAANSVLSGQISSFLSKHADLFMSLHVSDQYTGLKEDGRSVLM